MVRGDGWAGKRGRLLNDVALRCAEEGRVTSGPPPNQLIPADVTCCFVCACAGWADVIAGNQAARTDHRRPCASLPPPSSPPRTSSPVIAHVPRRGHAGEYSRRGNCHVAEGPDPVETDYNEQRDERIHQSCVSLPTTSPSTRNISHSILLIPTTDRGTHTSTMPQPKIEVLGECARRGYPEPGAWRGRSS